MAREGTLTAEEKQKAVDWINEKATLIGPCPTCNHRNWVVLDHLLYAPVFRANRLVVGGPAYPNVALLCENCGNTQYLNAVKMGVVASAESKPTPSEADDGT